MKYPEENTIKDILIGTAIGDAFGAGVEFQDRHWIKQHVDFTSFVNARASIAVDAAQRKLFTENYTPWDYTDDTEMTIGLIRALISPRPFSKDLLISEWHKEYRRGIEEKGYGRNGHGSMRWFYDGEKSIEEVRDFQRHRGNPGNAPAMRSVPLGLLEEDVIDKLAQINANATHPNIAAVLSSQCVARAAHLILIKKESPTKVIDYCIEHIDLNEEYASYLQKINRLPVFDQLGDEDFEILCGPQPIQAPYFLAGINGLPSDSKFTAGSVLYVLKYAKSAFEALQMSILFGGDVDSIASICTGIMAGKHGLKSIPGFMIQNVEGVDYLRTLAGQFFDWLKSKKNSKIDIDVSPKSPTIE